MKTYTGSGRIAPVILSLNASCRGVVNIIQLAAWTPGMSPGTNWVGPRAGLEVLEESILPLAGIDFKHGHDTSV
jgi:hypothetical protein